MAITDWVGHTDSNLLGIESIAADPVDPSRVYWPPGCTSRAALSRFLSSTDMGQTWARNDISAPMGGNADGRSMGERLATRSQPDQHLVLWLAQHWLVDEHGLCADMDQSQWFPNNLHGHGIRPDLRGLRSTQRLAGQPHSGDLCWGARGHRNRALSHDRRRG